jgi:hypothetical protein
MEDNFAVKLFWKTHHVGLQSINISNSITCCGTPQATEELGLSFSLFSLSDVGGILTTVLFPWATTTTSIMHEVSFP